MNSAANRRNFWRAAFRAEVHFVDASGATPAELVDISLKGALVKMPPQWHGSVGDTCHLRLRLADAAAIIMRAAVAHIEGRRVGLYCESIDIDSITHLRRLVELNAGDSALLERELSALVAA